MGATSSALHNYLKYRHPSTLRVTGWSHSYCIFTPLFPYILNISRSNQSDSSSDDDLPLHFVRRKEDDTPLHMITNARPASMEGRAWKRSGKKPELVYDNHGNDIAEEDPLASLRANYVWESVSDWIQYVMLEGPLIKQAPASKYYNVRQRPKEKERVEVLPPNECARRVW